MPICIIERDGRSAPIVICDFCKSIITDAADGNYEWFAGATGQAMPLYFTHKRCSRAFEDQQSPRDNFLCNMELAYFPIYLGNNLELDWEQAERNAGDMSAL